jgi:hypothetical protein
MEPILNDEDSHFIPRMMYHRVLGSSVHVQNGVTDNQVSVYQILSTNIDASTSDVDPPSLGSTFL